MESRLFFIQFFCEKYYLPVKISLPNILYMLHLSKDIFTIILGGISNECAQ